MKLHIVTVGHPKLPYAKLGFDMYIDRLKRMHHVRVSALNDKYTNDAAKFWEITKDSYRVALVIEDGKQLSSHELASFLEDRAVEGREVTFMIGGPDGLPASTISNAQLRLSFSPLTFPHDLAMVIISEALYRASTISSGHPYHH